ncbi:MULTISPECIES: hypothetical protein [Polymorphospora]|uniref:Peptidase M23 n=1 Tax=Polymorphospora lycopeni TaxID=3140240 RepID=A0ABV5CN69_9ACTN
MHPDDAPHQQPSPAPWHTRSVEPGSDGRRRGRHRAARHRRRTSTPVRICLAAGLTCCLGVVAVAQLRDFDPAVDDVRTDRAAVADRAAAAGDDAASRSYDRSPAPGPSPSPSASAAPSSPAPPAKPKPVAGLNQTQMDNAHTIVKVGRELDIPTDGLVVAVATAMQETNLRNLASDVVPESKKYPHEGTGSDHDSVGLFQQRPSTGWGSVRDLMDPEYAARRFYEALKKVDGWQRLSLTAAAQAVQKSAYPGAYAKHESRATTIVKALT